MVRPGLLRGPWWGGLLAAGLALGCRPDPGLRPPADDPSSKPSSCGEGLACALDQTCVEYFPIADRPRPAASACERVCSFDGDDCSPDEYCAMESAGPGFVCRPIERFEAPADIARVVELAEVWSQIRVYHPWLASRDVDWGAGLRDAIPLARQAESDEAMRAAVERMLAVLGDPATRVNGPPLRPPETDDSAPTRDEEGTLVVSVDRVQPFDREATAKVAEQIAGAERVVFDLRRWPSAFLPYLEVSFASWNPKLVGGEVELPTVRHRVIHGFPTEVGETSGGYYEGFETSVPARVRGERDGALPRVAFVVGPSQALPGVALPLLESGQGVVVATEPLSERAMTPTHPLPITGGFVELRAGETTYRGSLVALEADEVVSDEPVARARALVERRGRLRPRVLERRPSPKSSSSTPRAEDLETMPADVPEPVDRMHAAIDLWSTLDVFHAYPQLRPRWEGALARALVAMDDVQTWDAYARVMMTLAASAEDGHVGLQGRPYTELKGAGFPPFHARVVEGCLTVVAVGERAGGLAVGDVIAEIDGASFSERFGDWAPLVAASTPAAHRQWIGWSVLRGPADRPLRLRVERDGELRDVTVERGDPFVPEPKDPIYRLTTDSRVGVVDLSRLTQDSVPSMFEALAETEAIIFDMRGYPKGTAWTIAPYLDVHPGPTPAARFVRPRIFAGDPPGATGGTTFVQPLPEAAVSRYDGTTVMLIDESTQSQAEHTGLFFEAANGTRFVGTPTSGANGDVTFRVLPDGTAVRFTGQAVTAADGRPLQRVGLPPSLWVAPTIEGIRAGRDEVLEAAIEWLPPQPAGTNEHSLDSAKLE